MNALTRLFHLPLLVKELLEQAARPRTYWTRVAYGALLYLVVVVPEANLFRNVRNVGNHLGEGRELFTTLVVYQFLGIFLFLPALMCGRITQEKERDSLVLLLLTNLSPAQIVLQKYFAGLVPMLTFLLLGLPLAAVAYAFGGFPPGELVLAAVLLLLACLQVGALALWCSALFRTTVGAFIGTYAIGVAFYFGPALMVTIVEWFDPNVTGIEKSVVFMHIPPFVFEFLGNQRGQGGEDLRFFTAILATTTTFLALATHHLPRNAFAPPKRYVKRFFGLLDRAAQRANRFVGNIVLARRTHALPDDEPVLWRERRSRSMSLPAHLVRLWLLLQIPVTLFALPAVMLGDIHNYKHEPLSALAACIGTLGVLVLAVVASNTFVSERVSQTLEVLLTTPLAAREIVREKARALRGLTLVFAVPLLTTFACEAWLKWHVIRRDPYGHDGGPAWVYAVCAALAVVVYLPLVSWLALWIGLASRTRLRAIVLALLTIVTWCALPPFVLGVIFDVESRSASGWLFLSSPIVAPVVNEVGGLHELAEGAEWLPVLVNFTFYGLILYALRTHCLRRADEYLRR